MNNKIKKFLLLLSDWMLMYGSLAITLLIRYQNDSLAQHWQDHILPFSVIFIAWLLVFYVSGLYDLRGAVNDSGFWRLIFQSFLAGSAISVLFFYLSPSAEIAPKTNLVIFIVVFLILFIFWRRLCNRALSSLLPKNNVAIIGRNHLVEELLNEIKNRPYLGFAIGFIVDEKSQEKEIAGTAIFSTLKDLPELIEKKKINSVILAKEPDTEETRALLFRCLPLKISFINLTEFYETITGKIPVEAIGKMWFLENLNEGDKSIFDFSKRLADLCLALAILLVSLPFWIIFGLIIKIESRGPVFFKQRRSGSGGKPFKIIKFRTMKTEDNDQSPTKDNDKRITVFGNFLRKSRLDEIPQIINIIKGEMSFVGPRPERIELIEELEKQIPFYRERMLVKPGITGIDQTSGEYHSPSYEDTLKKLQYDLFYIKNRSLYLDIAVMLKTVRTVISRGGK